MADAQEVCVVLREGVTRADFEQAATASGLVHFETRPGGERAAYEQVWAWPDVDHPTAGVNYLESPFVSFPYLVVHGYEVPLLVGKLTAQLAAYTPGQLIDEAMQASTHDDQVHAVNRLAIGFVECNLAVLGIIMTFVFQAENPLLREAVVNAMGFRAWPQFRPLLERLAAEDPAENVRTHAARILAHWPS
jgi:hypothetical protein